MSRSSFWTQREGDDRIPTIGLMIASYIAMRCIEILAKSDERYSSGRAHEVDQLRRDPGASAYGLAQH